MNIVFKCTTHNYEILNVNYGEGEVDNDTLKYYIEHVHHEQGCNISRKVDGVDIDVGAVMHVTPEKLAELKQEKKNLIKKEAQERIYDIYLEYQQLNAIATVIELLRESIENLTSVDPISTLTQDKQDIFNEIYGNWNIIKTIRQKSNQIEAEDIDPVNTLLDLSMVKIKDNSKWGN